MNFFLQRPFIFLTFLLFSLFSGSSTWAEGDSDMALTLKSDDFIHQGEMPQICTCDGSDQSPALSWSDIPAGTKSLVLIVDDPDAPDPAKPKMTWVHWLLYNIPPTTTSNVFLVCGTRCPRAVDYARIAEACRAIILRSRTSKVDPDTVTAPELEEIPQQAFIASFRKFSV